jgi:hypothetical protein
VLRYSPHGLSAIRTLGSWCNCLYWLSLAHEVAHERRTCKLRVNEEIVSSTHLFLRKDMLWYSSYEPSRFVWVIVLYDDLCLLYMQLIIPNACYVDTVRPRCSVCFQANHNFQITLSSARFLLTKWINMSYLVAGIATGYGLDDRGVGVRVSVGFSLLHIVQTGFGAHPASYPVGTGVQAAGVWSWPLTSS